MTVRYFLLTVLISASALSQGPVLSRVYYPPAKPSFRMARAELPSSALTSFPQRFVLPLLNLAPVANSRGQMPVGAVRQIQVPVEGRWDALPDGRPIWRAALQTPAAQEVRVHFKNFSIGRGQLWVYGPVPGAVEGSYTGQGPNGDGDFWSATVPGDTITIEFQPEIIALSSTKLPFQVAEIAHVWSGMNSESASAVDASRSVAACHLDYKCYAELQSLGSGVVHLVFASDEDERLYVCSGALLNTRSSSFIPYLLTANHCVSTDSEARSVQAYWFYESGECNGPAPSRSRATRIDGARLLVTAGLGAGDYSLLRLTDIPSVPVTFAGWDPSEIPMGASVAGIHHPAGSYKRVSFGTRTLNRSGNIEGVVAPAEFYYQVQKTAGRIEGGSSGSPLFKDGQFVVGVLSYGPRPAPDLTVCDIDQFTAGYGRFSVAYPALRPFLEDQTQPVTVSPTSLFFRVSNGVVQSPSSQTVRIETAASTPVAFAVVTSAPWVRPSRTSGAVVSGSPSTLSITIDPATFKSPGVVNGSVTINAGSTAQTIQLRVDVSITQSSVIPSVEPDPVYEQDPDAEGYAWQYELTIRETAGAETRLTSLRIDGLDYSANIVSWFGSDRIPAFGSISTGLRTRNLTVPAERPFEFAGVDPATGATWSRRIIVRFLGRRAQASLKLTVTPNPVTQDQRSESCAWRHDVIVNEQSGIGVNLNRWIAGGHDLSGDIGSWFGSARLTGYGARRATLCWRSVRVPTTLNFEIIGRDDLGNEVTATVQGRFEGAPAQVQVLRILPESLAFATAIGQPGSLSAEANVDTGAAPWSSRVTYSGSGRNWLTLSPVSGNGATTVGIAASAAGLTPGRHTATIVIEAAGLGSAQLPVTFDVGTLPVPAPQLTSLGVVNAASFQRALAPGMLFTIVGTNLAVTEGLASRIPLPYAMGGAVVRINNILCPLLYVSGRQINAQLPYEVQPGRATLAVNVAGRQSTAQIDVGAVAPGTFTIDGQRPTPHLAGRRGDILVAYVTGAGVMSPPVATGDAPAASTPPGSLPRPRSTVEATVGGIRADVFFAGIPPGLVGLLQVNYRIPQNAPPGLQPLVFIVGGVPAPAVSLSVQP